MVMPMTYMLWFIYWTITYMLSVLKKTLIMIVYIKIVNIYMRIRKRKGLF